MGWPGHSSSSSVTEWTDSVTVQLHTFLSLVDFILSACFTNYHVFLDRACHLVRPTPFTCSLYCLWPLPPRQSNSLHLLPVPSLVPVYLGPLTCSCLDCFTAQALVRYVLCLYIFLSVRLLMILCVKDHYLQFCLLLCAIVFTLILPLQTEASVRVKNIVPFVCECVVIWQSTWERLFFVAKTLTQPNIYIFKI